MYIFRVSKYLRRRAYRYYAISRNTNYDDVIKWKHFPRFWPFLRWIHRSPVNSPQEGHRRGALMFSLICAWMNDWVNNREAGDLRHQRAAHYGAIVMFPKFHIFSWKKTSLLKLSICFHWHISVLLLLTLGRLWCIHPVKRYAINHTIRL